MNQPKNSVTHSAQIPASLGKILMDYYLRGTTRPIPLTIPARPPSNLPDAQQHLLKTLSGALDQAAQPQLDPRLAIASLRRADIILKNMKEPLPTAQPLAQIWSEIGQIPHGLPVLKALQGVSPVLEFEPGLSIIAAPTSAGKTTILIQQVLEWLQDPTQQGTILFWSAETSRAKLWAKLLANLAHMSMWEVIEAARQGLQTAALRQAYQTLEPVAHRLLVLDEDSTCVDLLNLGEQLASTPTGLTAIVVDYIQELPAVPDDHPHAGRYLQNRELEVGVVARLFRVFGHRLKIPIIAAAQFNRMVGKASRYVPDLLQLRESGRLEHSCELVIGLRNEVMSGVDGSSAQHSATAAQTKTYTMFDAKQLESDREGAMATVRTELGSDWILEEAFVLKNRSRGGVGTVIPFGLHPASGRCEPLPHRLLSLGFPSPSSQHSQQGQNQPNNDNINQEANEDEDDSQYENKNNSWLGRADM